MVDTKPNAQRREAESVIEAATVQRKLSELTHPCEVDRKFARHLNIGHVLVYSVTYVDDCLG